MLYKNILDQMPIGVFTADFNGKITYFNQKYRNILGFYGSPVKFGDCIQCINSVDGCMQGKNCAKCAINLALCNLKENETITTEPITRIVNQNGNLSALNFRLKLVKTHQNIIGILEEAHSLQDVTLPESLFARQNRDLMDEINKASSFFYATLPQSQDFQSIQFRYFSNQYHSLGGDLFDIYKINDHQTGIYIADVSGHGLLSGIIAAFVKFRFNKRSSPKIALEELSQSFREIQFPEETYISIFHLVIDHHAHTITYATAGFNEPIYLRHHKSVIKLEFPALPISNWFLQAEIQEKVISYSPKDQLFLHTDGLTDTLYRQQIFSDTDIGHQLCTMPDFFANLKELIQNLDAQFIQDDITFIDVQLMQ